jgi:hypothetical protein
MTKKRAPRPRVGRKPAPKPVLPENWRELNTLTIGQAAIVLDLGLNEAYAAANTDQIPVIRIGRSWRVSVPRLRRMIDGDGKAA